jgi:hypothetical protein
MVFEWWHPVAFFSPTSLARMDPFFRATTSPDFVIRTLHFLLLRPFPSHAPSFSIRTLGAFSVTGRSCVARSQLPGDSPFASRPPGRGTSSVPVGTLCSSLRTLRLYVYFPDSITITIDEYDWSSTCNLQPDLAKPATPIFNLKFINPQSAISPLSNRTVARTISPNSQRMILCPPSA